MPKRKPKSYYAKLVCGHEENSYNAITQAAENKYQKRLRFLAYLVVYLGSMVHDLFRESKSVISLFCVVAVSSVPSVHVLSAPSGSAVAGDLDVLNGELVVVGQLLAGPDLAQGEDDDVLLAEHVHDLGVAVGLQRIIETSRSQQPTTAHNNT